MKETMQMPPKGKQLRGDQRAKMAHQLAEEYKAGTSVHILRLRHGGSYSAIYSLLREAGALGV